MRASAAASTRTRDTPLRWQPATGRGVMSANRPAPGLGGLLGSGGESIGGEQFGAVDLVVEVRAPGGADVDLPVQPGRPVGIGRVSKVHVSLLWSLVNG